MKTKLTLSILFVLVIGISHGQTPNEKVTMPRHVPFQISFIPGFGTAGFQGYQVSTNVSLNMLAGMVHSVHGVEVGGLVNFVSNDVVGAQFGGLVNVVGNDFKGLQGGGLADIVIGNSIGAQFSGLAGVTIGDFKGAQVSGLVNYSKSIKGTQISGLANASLDSVRGFQISGLTNFSQSVKGLQLSGLLNIATKEVDGAQVAGLVNIAPKVKGWQIGVVNIADTIENGAMIGIFNFVRHGMHKFEVSHEDVLDFNFSYRGGTNRLYSILTVGLKPQNQAFWSTGFGFGTHVNVKDKIYYNVEATTNMLQTTEKKSLNGNYLLNRVNVNVGYKINDNFSINAGPVLNIYVQNLKDDGTETSLANIGTNGFYDKRVNQSRVKMWLGYRVGFRF